MKNKINEKIPEIHEMRKKLGAWDGYPEQASPADGYSEFYLVKKQRNAYLAHKLDEIIWTICDAMRARKEDRNSVWHQHAPDYHPTTGEARVNLIAYQEHCIGGYQYHLTLALLLTLDFLGWSGQHGRNDTLFGKAMDLEQYVFPQTDAVEIISRKVQERLLYGASRMLMGNIRLYPTFGPVVSGILRIAELDKIDFEWHLDVMCQYMKVRIMNRQGKVPQWVIDELGEDFFK